MCRPSTVAPIFVDDPNRWSCLCSRTAPAQPAGLAHYSRQGTSWKLESGMQSTSSQISAQLKNDGMRWNSRDSSSSLVHLDDTSQPYSPQQYDKHRSAGSYPGAFTDVPVKQGNGGHYRSPQREPSYTARSRPWERLESSRSHVSHQPPPVSSTPSENSGHHHYAYGPPMPYPTHSSSSFESYGSAHGPYPPHPHYVVSGPIVNYPFGATMHAGHPGHSNGYYQSWGPPPKPIEYIRNIKSGDVLCGRGGATNSHPGNRSFRCLVKRHQDRYLRAKKRDKPSVASTIVELIRERGGRFLRRCDTSVQGDVLWVDIGDERAREKTCQALREGAPELRRRRRGASLSDEEDKDESPKKKISISRGEDEKERTSPKSYGSSISNSPMKADRRSDSRDDLESPGETSSMERSEDGPIVIRPCSRLMCRPVRDIPLSELSSRDQQMYLHDFLPPHPNIKESSRRKRIVVANPIYSPASDDSHGKNSETWEV